MSQEDDNAIIAEIRAHADRGEKDKPKLQDLTAFAAALAEKYPSRPFEDILEQAKAHYRKRELFWRD